MRHTLEIGPSPPDEECVQVGTHDYVRLATAECDRFIELLRKTFGPEPEGARLSIRRNPHDFGAYYEVVCAYDDRFPASIDYAFRCEDETPRTWAG